MKKLYAQMAYQHQDVERQNRELKEKNVEIHNKLKRTMVELRDLKEMRDRLLGDNSELLAKINALNRSYNMNSKVKLELDGVYTSIKEQLIEAHSTINKQSA
jgi:predicted nuclease with TOPRIM domain